MDEEKKEKKEAMEDVTSGLKVELQKNNNK